MSLKSLESANVAEKKILVRVDVNIEMNDIVEIAEHFRLDIIKKTVDHLCAQSGTKVALLTHFGRPEGKPDPAFSTSQLVPSIERALGKKVVFVPECVGEAVETALMNLEDGAVLLLENVRFHAEEEAGDETFAAALARPFDVFVNEAFSVCHRDHASVTKVPKCLPSYAGFRLLREIEKLDAVRLHPAHPAIAVIGGAKIETKLPLIRAMEEGYDCVLVGGKIANEALDQGITFSPKVLLPYDFDSDKRLDIGPETAAYYAKIIKTGKTIIWNGPMGKFEEKPYDIGTGVILNALLESDAMVVIGGGESLAVVEAADVMNKIGFVSSGGGAMLEYMSGKTLPGLTALSS